MSEKIDYSKGIYDAKSLGTPKLLILGTQHMFAMFGATVLVPLLTGLSVSTTLLCAGLGTLLFHFLCKGKVPAFLGSSFAYLGGFTIVTNGGANPENLPYACAAVALSGLVYVLFSALISAFGIRKMMRFFPPVVTGPIIISIGLILAPSAITNCQSNWLLAFVALGTVIVCNIWGKGMVKILPILIGVLVSYAVALVTGAVDFQKISEAAWLGIPLHKEAMGLFAIDGSPEFISALFTIIPIALATMMEHVGDIAAISATVGHNYINDPGLNRTLMGDGLATTMAGLLGGPANTTYGENTGVLALSKIYDPLVIRIAAVLAIILSFSPKFEAVINTIPSGIVGGISIMANLLIVSGVLGVLESTGAFSAGIHKLVRATKGKELSLVVIMYVLFTVFGVLGYGEGAYPFYGLAVMVIMSAGYDRMTGAATVILGSCGSFACGMLNLFTTGVSQQIVGLPMFSGMTLRLVLFVALLLVSMAYVMWHANRVKKHPEKSPCRTADLENAKKYVLDVENIAPLTGRQKLVLVVLLLAILWTIYGVLVHGYYIDELAAVFLTAGVVAVCWAAPAPAGSATIF